MPVSSSYMVRETGTNLRRNLLMTVAAMLTVAVSLLALAAVAAFYLFAGRRPRGIPVAPAHVGPPSERRALLLVDELPDQEILSTLRRHADRVLVVSLARTSPLRRWVSDVDPARTEAHARLEDVVARLRSLQVDASGVVGDGEASAAVDDALRTFGGDEIVVVSRDPQLVGRLRDRYAIPVAAGL